LKSGKVRQDAGWAMASEDIANTAEMVAESETQSI
jgi:hypothetical protein